MSKVTVITKEALRKARERLNLGQATAEVAPEAAPGDIKSFDDLAAHLTTLIERTDAEAQARLTKVEERFGAVDAAFGILEDSAEERDAAIYDADPDAGPNDTPIPTGINQYYIATDGDDTVRRAVLHDNAARLLGL